MMRTSGPGSVDREGSGELRCHPEELLGADEARSAQRALQPIGRRGVHQPDHHHLSSGEAFQELAHLRLEWSVALVIEAQDRVVGSLWNRCLEDKPGWCVDQVRALAATEPGEHRPRVLLERRDEVPVVEHAGTLLPCC
jgi:hypothetical protein